MVRRVFSRVKSPGQIIWQTGEEFLVDSCPQMAAAISFYALFSLPPLTVLLIMLVEPFLDPESVRTVLQREAVELIGRRAASQVEGLVGNVSRPGQGGPLATTLGIGAFLFGATAAFAQLQAALNAAWQVGPDPRRGDVLNFLLKRVLSFAMILIIGVLLLASLLLSTILTAFGSTLEHVAPGLPSASIMQVAETSTSFAVISILFAGMYRYLPDAEVGWRPALFGGVVTALLFTAGKVGIGYYLGSSDPGSAFGAAGSLALVLIWIYYSSMMLLLGAEFTQVWMRRRGDPIEPSPGAVRIVHKQERQEGDEVSETKKEAQG